jgi:hypothetical protein
MLLAGTILRADQTRYKVMAGAVKSVNTNSGEVRGSLELAPGISLANGYSTLYIEGEYNLEVKLLSSSTSDSGRRRYKFVAIANRSVLEAMDLMLSADKHPTILEKFMR